MQGRLGLVCQQEKSFFFPEGTTMWLEMENSVATGGLLARGAVEWLPFCYSKVEVELHRSVGSLVQSRQVR